MSAYAFKEPGSLALNQAIQQARDNTACTCGHLNVSHGYPEADYDGTISTAYYRKWPDGSFIGMGACGIESCACPGFIDTAREAANHA